MPVLSDRFVLVPASRLTLAATYLTRVSPRGQAEADQLETLIASFRHPIHIDPEEH